MSKYKSIRIGENYKEILSKLLAVSDLKTEKDYIESALNYFTETGLDPLDKIQSISGEVKKMKDTVISFIRTHEKTKLLPMLNQVDEVTNTFVEYLRKSAPIKNDLQLILDRLDKLDKGNIEIKKDIPTNNNTQAKLLFEKFISEMQPGITNYKIDKKLVKHYQNQFNSLG
ncbi:MAG TPA: hypothetical protein DCG75_04565 [Bacteroidales bacterium]|nr:hypothetical protein [Bacteroidales bacterium]